MNKFGILRKIDQDLKYTQVDKYIGNEIPIDISKNGEILGKEIKELVEEHLDLKIRSIKDNNMEGTIAKYGMIDINLEIENSVSINGKKGIQILRENGWIDEENDDEYKKEGFEFLKDMIKEIDEGKTYLKIRASSINQKEKWFKEKAYLLQQLIKGEKPKPRPEDKDQIFKIDDMCVTNYSGIWLWKYFYM